MFELILTTIGGTTIALALVAFLGKNLILNNLRKDLEHFKIKMQRDLSLEARRDSYKSALAIRQLDAAQEFWSLFDVTSLSNDSNSIIKGPFGETPQFDLQKARNFIEKFNSVFSNKSGLYISKSTRVALHEFRDFINTEMVVQYENSRSRALSTEQISKFKKLRTAARTSLREEVGSNNITIAKEEYGGGEESA
ncbi:hypothetical protein D3C78_1139030 [compost metagenome]